jgi:hypothetical protein
MEELMKEAVAAMKNGQKAPGGQGGSGKGDDNDMEKLFDHFS